MGQLAVAARELEKAAPAFFASIRQIINKGENPDVETGETTEEPVIAENVNKKPELIKDDYQLKNIKRLIHKK